MIAVKRSLRASNTHLSATTLDIFQRCWRANPIAYCAVFVIQDALAFMAALWSFSSIPSFVYCESSNPCSCSGGGFEIFEPFCSSTPGNGTLSNVTTSQRGGFRCIARSLSATSSTAAYSKRSNAIQRGLLRTFLLSRRPNRHRNQLPRRHDRELCRLLSRSRVSGDRQEQGKGGEAQLACVRAGKGECSSGRREQAHQTRDRDHRHELVPKADGPHEQDGHRQGALEVSPRLEEAEVHQTPWVGIIWRLRECRSTGGTVSSVEF